MSHSSDDAPWMRNHTPHLGPFARSATIPHEEACMSCAPRMVALQSRVTELHGLLRTLTGGPLPEDQKIIREALRSIQRASQTNGGEATLSGEECGALLQALIGD